MGSLIIWIIEYLEESTNKIIEIYDIWVYNWRQNYVSKWNPMGIVYAYRESKGESDDNEI